MAVTNKTGVCSIGVGDARLEGDSFEQALRDAPDFEDKLSATGPGTGSVRWVEFASTSSLGHKRYDLFALDPRLVREVGTVSQYYGFEINASCMTRAMARELVRTVSLTPLAGAR